VPAKLQPGGTPMEALKDTLWPIAAFGFIGAFIDFVIGKRGQERVKDYLLRWWVLFNDVHWNNFGRKEADLAVLTLESLFGAKLIGFRRIFTATLYYTILVATVYVLYAMAGGVVFISLDKTNVSTSAATIIMGVVGFVCAISVSLLLGRISKELCGNSIWRNVVVFSTSTLANYIALLIWFPLTSSVKLFIWSFVFSITSFGIDGLSVPIIENFMFELARTRLNAITQFWLVFGEVKSLVQFGNDAPTASSVFLQIISPMVAYIPIAFRLLISIFFVVATISVALFTRPVSVIWARLIESEKPAFTLLFGGAAALATAFMEVMKHL
jgi:hypothetical protein